MVKQAWPKIGVSLFTTFLWLGMWFHYAFADSSQVIGEITIQYEANEASEPLQASSGTTVTGKGLSTQHVMTTKAKVCIQNGKALVGDVTHDLNWLQEKDVKTVYDKIDCTPIHRTRSNLDIRRPGNWERTALNLRQVILEPEVAQKKFKTTFNYRPGFSMNRVSDGKYTDKTRASGQGGMPAGRYHLFFGYESVPGHVRLLRHSAPQCVHRNHNGESTRVGTCTARIEVKSESYWVTKFQHGRSRQSVHAVNALGRRSHQRIHRLQPQRLQRLSDPAPGEKTSF